MRNTSSAVQVLYDIDHNYGQDLSYSAVDDLQTCSDITRSQQRILRRLLTQPGNYVWHPDYGAGLQQYIGQPLSSELEEKIKSNITSQIFLEESVAKNPAPIITIQTIQQGLFCQIQYTVAPANQPVVISFQVGGN